MPPKTASVGGQNPEFILREFQGMNLLDEREAINDNDFYWCENAIPIGGAKLFPVNGPSAALATVSAETGAPSYTINFNEFGTDYAFAVWSGSGNGYIVNLSAFTFQKIVSGLLTSGQTSAVQYANEGLLIIDPAGYWDWNITTPSTLTPQNNSAAIATLVGIAATVAGGTQLKQIVTGAGTGATFQALYQVTTVTLVNPGTGYAVGDAINLTDGSPTTPAQIIVASISGGGATGPITGITLATGGSYPGPTTSTLIATGPSGTVSTTTGAGTGATFTDHIQATALNILTRGTGYTGTTTVVDETTTPTVVDTWNITSSGVIGGNAISTYAGRVWIANGRTVYFTDINSYNSFGGVGGSFFISDSYLHDNITALYAANNYLYIFGDTSIDALSNVTVSAGVTFFSRINVTGSVGTSTPTSIFPYYRALVFYHSTGFYLLAGATPEKISDKIAGLIQNLSTVIGYPRVYGCQIQVRNELCAALLFTFQDIFVQQLQRSIIALYFRNRWWVTSLIVGNTYVDMQAMLSIPIAGLATAFVWVGNSLYQAVDSASPLTTWVVKTKLWDGGAPVHDKQSVNAAIAGKWTGVAPTGVTMNIDTEVGTAVAAITPLQTVTAGYHFNLSAVNQGGTQYLGLTVQGSTAMSQIDMLALRGTQDRDKLQ
jgi:hypothetical protein